jgi:hypothetical protein
MILLKPRGGFRRLTPGLYEVIDLFPEGPEVPNETRCSGIEGSGVSE